MAQTVIVKIVNGEAVVTTKGFAGKACKAATADLEKNLGLTQHDEATAEMYAQPTTAQVKAR